MCKSKICTQCKIEKPLTEFQKNNGAKPSFRANCKECAYKKTRQWNRSPKGIAVRAYHKQIRNSKVRGHGAPEYTQEWLVDYMLNHPDFEKLYSNYVSSSYDKYCIPSIDRIDDNIGYTKENIRLVSFRENMTHCYSSARKAEHTNSGWDKGCMRAHHAVVQLTLKGEFINRYISVNEAARETGGCNSKIPACCSGRRLSHAGYQFVYAEDYDKANFIARDLTNRPAPKSKRVRQLTLAGTYIAEYESATIAARELGYSQSGISRCALGKSCKYKNFKWEYVSSKN